MKKNETMEKLKELLINNGFIATKEMGGLGGWDLELDVFNSEFRKVFEKVCINIKNYDIVDKYTMNKRKQA